MTTGGEAVHTVVVSRAGVTIDTAALTEHVKIRKGSLYTTKSISVVDALPTTTVGKIDKKVLRAPFWAGQERQVH